jgi:hypothetical protein
MSFEAGIIEWCVCRLYYDRFIERDIVFLIDLRRLRNGRFIGFDLLLRGGHLDWVRVRANLFIGCRDSRGVFLGDDMLLRLMILFFLSSFALSFTLDLYFDGVPILFDLTLNLILIIEEV